MTVTLLNRPPAWAGLDGSCAAPLVVSTGRLLDHPVRVEVDRPLPGISERLLAELNRIWDASDRRSELHRLRNYPGIVRTVSQPTLALVSRASAFAAASSAGQHLAVIDHRHGRAGVDPVVADLLTRLIPDTAADLLADLCRAAGVRTGWLRIGTAVRLIDQLAVGEPGIPA